MAPFGSWDKMYFCLHDGPKSEILNTENQQKRLGELIIHCRDVNLQELAKRRIWRIFAKNQRFLDLPKNGNFGKFEIFCNYKIVHMRKWVMWQNEPCILPTRCV